MEPTTVSEIANFLRVMKASNSQPVLFLGSRAGTLFGNAELHKLIMFLSDQPFRFDQASEVEKFQESYRILSRQSEATIYGILSGALNQVGYRHVDSLLVDLVRAGYFNLLISTNFDRFLERAFNHENLWEPDAYTLFIPGIHPVERNAQRRAPYCQIIKAFGDIGLRTHRTVGAEFDLIADRDFKQLLEDRLRESILVVGYDPLWDQPIAPAFPAQGGDFWYVNEEEPPEHSPLHRALNRRHGGYFVSEAGSYSNFIHKLHAELLGIALASNKAGNTPSPQTQHTSDTRNQNPEVLPQEPVTTNEVSPLPLPTENRKLKKTFICYSHQDKRYLKQLQTMLANYERNGLVDVWADTKIEVGAIWREEIKKALEEAKIAVLLVSADFLASKFIAENELPPLLEMARTQGTRIIVVFLRPCPNDATLLQYQTVNSPSRPLSLMRAPEREKVWVKVAELIKDA